MQAIELGMSRCDMWKQQASRGCELEERLAMREGLGALTLEKKKLVKASYVRQKSHVSSHDKLEGWRATEKGHDMTM